MTLRIALILDGSSDAALRFPCEWLLRRHNRDASVEVLPEPKPRPNLKQRILAALKTEPNILLVHRDAEKETWESRRQEIQRAVDSAGMGNVVGVVPVRMTMLGGCGKLVGAPSCELKSRQRPTRLVSIQTTGRPGRAVAQIVG